MTLSFENDRFSIWGATPSLNRILIRSPKNDVEGKHHNIDIVFWGVRYLNIPFALQGIQIDQATDIEVKEIKECINNDLDNEEIFVIMSEGKRYYIAAVNYTVQENTLDIFDMSILKV